MPAPIADAARVTGGLGTARADGTGIIRARHWFERYTARVLTKAYKERWHGETQGLRAGGPSGERGIGRGRPAAGSPTVGEATGPIRPAIPIGDRIEMSVVEAIDDLECRSRAYLEESGTA